MAGDSETMIGRLTEQYLRVQYPGASVSFRAGDWELKDRSEARLVILEHLVTLSAEMSPQDALLRYQELLGRLLKVSVP